MKKTPAITTLLIDIGGVLLSNGWDHHARRRAARRFGLDYAEFDGRHRLVFELHERGRMTFDEYLDQVVFERPRRFTRGQFRRFMLAQSRRLPGAIEFVRELKARHGLQIVVVSNESRAVNAHRIRKFKLDDFVDSFISSCFVHLRKPDPEIFRLALDIAQAPVRKVLYIENTPMFVQVAEKLGIRSILHADYASTFTKLATLGLRND